MNNYEDWAQLVAKRLKGEADIIAAIEKDELDDAAATEAFVRAVLEPFLPENFGVGSGKIVDAFGNYSDHLDVVVYNRDFPRIGMVGANSAYLYESVLATFSVRAKFLRKTFFDSMDACASLEHLQTNIDKAVLVKLAKKNGLKAGPNKTFVHDDPLRSARFELIGRPPAFVYGFSGFKTSFRQLQENIELWIDNRINDGIATPMKSLPAVIATQGCFAWRNAAPLALSNREMLGVGTDDAPIRLIVLQMLYLLNRRLNVTSDGYGLKPSLNAYLSQFSPPNFEVGVGDVSQDVSNQGRAARDTMRFEPAKDRAAVEEAVAAAKASSTAKAPVAKAEPAPKPAAAKAVPAPVKAEPVPEPPAAVAEPAAVAAVPEKLPAAIEEAQQPAAQAAVFDNPSPFASTPSAAKPEAPELPELEPAKDSAVFDKPSPFASAPVPPPAEEPEAPRAPAPVSSLGSAPIPGAGPSSSAPLGSAPIPQKAEPEPAAEAKPPAAPLGSAPIPAADTPKIIPAKPPVDFDLGADEEPPATGDARPGNAADQDNDDDFTNTVVIPPNASASATPSRNSTDAFIARVKEQLSSSEPLPESEQDPFSSTIPQ